MFCSNCGTQMPDGSKFCASCGNQMSAPVQAAQPVQPQSVQPQPVQPKPVQPQPVQPMYANQTMPVTIQGSKFNWKVFIIMMLVGLLIIGAGVAVIADIVDDGEFNLFGLLDGNQDDDDDKDDKDDKNDKDDKDDEDEDDDRDDDAEEGRPVATVRPDDSMSDHSYYGLSFEIPGSFVENDGFIFYNDEINVYIEVYGLDTYDGADSAKELANWYVEMLEYNDMSAESGKQNGTYYVLSREDGNDNFTVYGVYTDGETAWIIHIEAINYSDNLDLAIEIACSGELD